MLAKNYKYGYEAILSRADVKMQLVRKRNSVYKVIEEEEQEDDIAAKDIEKIVVEASVVNLDEREIVKEFPLAQAGYYYPVYNIDRMIEQLEGFKNQFEKEIIDKKIEKEEEIIKYILNKWKNEIKQEINFVGLRVILEEGYKETLQSIEVGTGIFKFDFSELIRVIPKQEHTEGVKREPIVIDRISVLGNSYRISKLDPDAMILEFDYRR